jgi:hypothetical protein
MDHYFAAGAFQQLVRLLQVEFGLYAGINFALLADVRLSVEELIGDMAMGPVGMGRVEKRKNAANPPPFRK